MNEQSEIIFRRATPGVRARFSGASYSPGDDDARLSDQLQRIKAVVLDGQWRTLTEIAEAAQAPQASVSAQLRHLRKARFGGYVVDKRSRGERSKGLFEYCVTEPVGGAVATHKRRSVLLEMRARLERLERLVEELRGDR